MDSKKRQEILKYSIVIGTGLFVVAFLITYEDILVESFSENKVINPDKYEYSIPNWTKGIAGFWAQEMVSDDQYFATLQWAIDHGYLKISNQTTTIHEYNQTTITCTCDMEER